MDRQERARAISINEKISSQLLICSHHRSQFKLEITHFWRSHAFGRFRKRFFLSLSLRPKKATINIFTEYYSEIPVYTGMTLLFLIFSFKSKNSHHLFYQHKFLRVNEMAGLPVPIIGRNAVSLCRRHNGKPIEIHSA